MRRAIILLAVLLCSCSKKTIKPCIIFGGDYDYKFYITNQQTVVEDGDTIELMNAVIKKIPSDKAGWIYVR